MGRTILRFLRSLNEFPENRFPAEYNKPHIIRAYVFANFAYFVGLNAHAMFLIIFLFLSVKFLALFNIISVTAWSIAFLLLRRGYIWQSFAVGATELIAHAVVCVVVIGWDTGFQYYIFVLPTLIALSHWKLPVKLVIATIFTASFIVLAQYASLSEPYIQLSQKYVLALNYMNIIIAVFLPFFSAYVFFYIAVKLEKKLDKAHRKTNGVLKHLNGELSEAADYVRKILPPPIPEGAIHTDWRFVPSTSLGGDAFGYHKVDKDHFGIYLIDVSGHGVGAALLSISVINVLRSQSLPKTDFKDPAQVLRSLNLAFPSESNKDMFFTMWYGVYNQNSRELKYASGGHPPAILFKGNPDSESESNLLRTPNNVVGGMSESTYRTERCSVGDGSTLYVFSDGVYEVEKQDGSMWRFQEFTDYMQKIRTDGHDILDRLYGYVKELGNSETLEDDFTILEVAFT